MADEHLISLQPGTIIAGRYEVVKCLGAGSMGLVYACRHRELSGHLVAVKVLFPEVAQDKIAAARFRNEIFASYGVSHPNVVRAYEYLRDGDLVAYTMEYVGGGDLADRLSNGNSPIAISDIIRMLGEMCGGVQAIHDSGIVHRDLKPENILLTKENHVKIADFGIARTGHGPKLTEHGGVVGTIDYVSPEYMLDAQVDWRSDIYAIGILGYEMITGESPFRGDSVYATMTKRLKSDAKPPSALRNDCPPELDTVILKAMARNPVERYQSAAEMFYDLQKLLPDETIGSGSYVNVLKPGSGTYVGPIVREASGSVATRSETAVENTAVLMSEDIRNGRSEESLIENPGQSIGALSNVSSGPQYSVKSGEMQTAHSYTANAPSSSGRMRSEALNEYSAGYSYDTDYSEPARMESVLSGRGDFTRGNWGESENQEITVSVGTINREHMRKLHRTIERNRSVVWVDFAVLVFAVLLGVGVGYMFLKIVAPELLTREITGQNRVDVWDSGVK